MEAHLTVKNTAFDVQHLSFWCELVSPHLQTGAFQHLEDTPVDVEAAEEMVLDAQFKEVIVRISTDERLYLEHKMNTSKMEGQRHILMVQHHKQQNSKGQQSLARLHGACELLPT